MKGLILTFNNEDFHADYITTSLVINENYYKDLKPVDNSCKLDAVYTIQLSNLLKLYAEEDIKAIVYSDDDVILFSGFLRKTFTFTKTQRNQPISLEIVSPSYFLDKELKNDVFKTSDTVGTIINAIGSDLGLQLHCNLTEIVDFFHAKKGTKAKELITQLLYEYGYTYDFNNLGVFVTYPLFNVPGEEVSHAFTGLNCLEQIQIKRNEKQYSGVTAKWQKKEYLTDTLLYEDTQGATTSFACSIDVAPRSYMYGNENEEGKHYLNFDSTKGKVLYASNIWPVVSGTYIESLVTEYENCGDSVLWSAYNPSMVVTATYHKFQWWGRAWVAVSENENKTTVTGDKSLSLDIKYLNDSSLINDFIQKVADYYRFSLFNLTVKSKDDVILGSFVSVEDYGIGKITGRVIAKNTDYRGIYTYTIESISEYEPASMDSESNSISKLPSDGFTSHIAEIKNITDSLQAQISEIEYTGTTCLLDRSTVTLGIDDNGFTQNVQTFSVRVILRRSEEDINFIIGNEENPFIVPQGWSYTIDGDRIIFTVGEGVHISAGAIKIPIIYTPILSDAPFVDENGNHFVDENGAIFKDIIYGESGTVWNLYLSYLGSGIGRYLGKFTTIAQIEASNPNISDFFTWGGENNLVTDLTVDKVLLLSQVYKYVGNGKTWSWIVDTNSGHMQAALSDVLGISNDDLKENNNTVWEYLDHLTTNSVYTGMVIANEGFIDKLATTLIDVKQLVSGSQVDEKILASESETLNKTFSELGFTSTTGHTLIEGNKIKTSFIDVDAITAGFIKADEITSGQGTFTGLVSDDAEFTNANIYDAHIKSKLTVEGDYLATPTVHPFIREQLLRGGIRAMFLWADGGVKYKTENIDSVTKIDTGTYLVKFNDFTFLANCFGYSLYSNLPSFDQWTVPEEAFPGGKVNKQFYKVGIVTDIEQGLNAGYKIIQNYTTTTGQWQNTLTDFNIHALVYFML